MKTLTWIIGVAVVAGIGLWLVLAQATDRVIAAWLDSRANEGWVVNYDRLDTGGFPMAFETRFAHVTLADPETGWVWTAPDFTLTRPTFRPDRVRADWPNTQTIASPFERLDIQSEALWADLDVQPARGFALDASSTTMTDLQINSSLGGQTHIAAGGVHVTRVPGESAQYDILFEATQLTPPEQVAQRLDPAGLLPAAMDLARYEARMRFDRPWDLTALEQARPQITEIDLAEMRAQWGSLLLRASGQLAVDGLGRPTGEVALRAENWREMLDIGVRAGALSPGLRNAAETTLGFVAGLSGRAEDIDATLRFEEGFVFFGPLPIGEAPRFILR